MLLGKPMKLLSALAILMPFNAMAEEGSNAQRYSIVGAPAWVYQSKAFNQQFSPGVYILDNQTKKITYCGIAFDPKGVTGIGSACPHMIFHNKVIQRLAE